MNIPSHLDELVDVDVDTTPPADGQALLFDLATGVWRPGDPGNFNPDVPLDYFTMTDTATGDVVEVSIAAGAWVLATINPRITEAGDRRITEDGNVRITES